MSVTTPRAAGDRQTPTPPIGGILRTTSVVRRMNPVWKYMRVLVPAIGVWYLVALTTNNLVILPSPFDVAKALVGLCRDGSLLDSVSISMQRLGLGFGVAVVTCVPLGLAMGLSETLGSLVDPIVEILRPISGIAWIPLALILFGVGETLVVFIIFYGCAFPLIVNTVSGVRQVDRHLIEAARTFGVSRRTIITNVVLPGALPTILTGARIAVGSGWMSLVAAELVGAHSGLGFSVQYYNSLLMTPKMIGFIVMIGFLGMLWNVALVALQRRLTPWARRSV